ncbi:DUF5666 domain-containing protein [Marinobacter sp. 2_MG-2023]|uniref:DUF5666 domain-containing protein n=1 Tax=Marinobacter sp. 2_MG-2023 TaxID=3062679 RepID=UPI0026E390AE|nr:DUF5666 domain-containing protein [Marinobacter sp. 2_MG-2023]MDO6442777.1 DUF5666 domain-containing protein [Marinobacter sp. 2_MG-2023]
MQLIARKRLVSILVAALTICVISGCDGNSVNIAEGGIRGTGSSVGPVSGFGSVFVNGIEFDTDGIRDRGVEGNDGIDSERILHEGMILRVDGEWRHDDTGTASSMAYDDTLRGTVSNLATGSNDDQITFEIHGQPVFADRQTVFDEQSRANLENGDFVRVSAWRQPDGVFRASYIGVNFGAFGDSAIELEGPVDAGSVGGGQFKMNGQIIKFDDLSFVEGLTSGDLQSGVYFEVEGDLDLASDAVVAARIQPNDFRRYQPSDKNIYMAGPVSSDYIFNERTFGLNGMTIQVTAGAELVGIELEDINEGLLVQVEGESVGSNLVLASQILALDSDAEIRGVIDTVDPGADRLYIGGVGVQITPRTIISDDEAEERLTINDLIPGAGAIQVGVAGLQKEDIDGTVYVEAINIQRELGVEPDGTYELEGVLDMSGVSFSSITVLGVTINAPDEVFDGVLRDEVEALFQGEEKVVLEVEYRRMEDFTDQYEASSIELN